MTTVLATNGLLKRESRPWIEWERLGGRLSCPSRTAPTLHTRDGVDLGPPTYQRGPRKLRELAGKPKNQGGEFHSGQQAPRGPVLSIGTPQFPRRALRVGTPGTPVDELSLATRHDRGSRSNSKRQ